MIFDLFSKNRVIAIALALSICIMDSSLKQTEQNTMAISSKKTVATKIAKKERKNHNRGPANCMPRINQLMKLDKIELGEIYSKVIEIFDLSDDFYYPAQQNNCTHNHYFNDALTGF